MFFTNEVLELAKSGSQLVAKLQDRYVARFLFVVRVLCFRLFSISDMHLTRQQPASEASYSGANVGKQYSLESSKVQCESCGLLNGTEKNKRKQIQRSKGLKETQDTNRKIETCLLKVARG